MQEANEIGAFEAKTRLSELLRLAEQGQSFVIMRRGRPVARLLPYESDEESDFAEILAEFREIRARSKPVESIRELIDEGRKW